MADTVGTTEGCFQWFKDTNLKANHNYPECPKIVIWVVFNGSKILIWKQITTGSASFPALWRCFQWFKDTNLKANHNSPLTQLSGLFVVFNGSKILIWKQITTASHPAKISPGCFQWFKDTNLKANHNYTDPLAVSKSVVFNGSKILIWKQITTIGYETNMLTSLFSMVQRY